VGLLAVLALGALLTGRPARAAAADPTIEAARVATLEAAAQDADRALGHLISQLEAAIDAGRNGAALIVDGKADPGPAFDRAAMAAGSATSLAVGAAGEMTTLGGVLAAVRPSLGPLPNDPFVSGIADQLTAAGEVGRPFVERRLAADATLRALGDALVALQDDDPQSAIVALDRADASLEAVKAWPEPPSVLPLWLETTGAMADAARAIATATIDQDPAAAARAARAYERAAQGARHADTALALAISEVGSSLASTPLRRLADALAAAIAQRQAVERFLRAGA
jgi:hypothetical protein